MRLLILDGHRLFGEAVAQALSARFEIAGVLSDGLEAFAWLDCHPADLVIVDLCLPGKPGRQVIAELRLLRPELKLLAIFAHDGPGYRRTLRELGANGFIPKSASWEVFADALDAVAAGVRWTTAHEVPSPAGSRRISDIQHQILECLLYLPVKAIARRLGLGVRTVELQLHHLRRFFGAANNTEVVREAIARGFLPVDPLLAEPLNHGLQSGQSTRLPPDQPGRLNPYPSPPPELARCPPERIPAKSSKDFGRISLPI